MRPRVKIPVGDRADCPAIGYDNGIEFICTRDEGHDGPHAAHGLDPERPVFVWNDEPDAECAECRGECDACGEPRVELVAIFVHPGTGRTSVFRLSDPKPEPAPLTAEEKWVLRGARPLVEGRCQERHPMFGSQCALEPGHPGNHAR